MSACMSGTRGSSVLSSTGDVLVRGVGGVCVFGSGHWVWALPILWGQGECWTCVCVLVAVV